VGRCADARPRLPDLQPLSVKRGHVAAVVGKVGEIFVAQLEVPSWLAGRSTFLRGARQPTPHAAASHPEPAGDCVHLSSREQPSSAQAEKPSHCALSSRTTCAFRRPG
jgi:hypothetical protein